MQGSGSILCIGTDLIHLNLRCSLLQEHGWNAISSASGHEGVMRSTRESPAAAILDLDGDGAESALIASELKRACPGIPIVMVVEAKEDLSPGATLQADALVLKSEEARRLVEVLKSVLRPR